jgi:hypothetical protein
MAASPKFERSLQPTAETRPKLLYLYTSSRTKSIQSVVVIGGFTCIEIGRRLPVLGNIRAPAIFATFIPSALAYYKLPPQNEKSVIEFTKYTNFFYLLVACVIVVNILGMDRQVLVKGFLKSSCRLPRDPRVRFTPTFGYRLPRLLRVTLSL